MQQKKMSKYVKCLLCGWSLVFLFALSGGAQLNDARDWQAPPPNPPHVELPESYPTPTERTGDLRKAPTTEWVYHKTTDGTHPDGNEQQMMWLMNRARSNPAQEGYWLATTTISSIAFPRSYFGVNTTLLRTEFNGYSAKSPAAFDRRLYTAAYNHSLDLIARDAQDHTNQFARITAAGFTYTSVRGNVFSYADDSFNAHGGFNIDWGNDADGMQDGRGHRMAVMSIDGAYSNVGIAMVPENNPSTEVGPLVTTGNYCAANTSVANHYNRFIVGTVWQDTNGDGFYSSGEGISGVTVKPDKGTYYAITGNSGGYAIPITAANTYTVTFSGAASSVQTVTVGTVSVLLDLKVSSTTSNSYLLWTK